MFGPVANHSNPSVGSAIFAEILGTVAIYLAFFGRMRPPRVGFQRLLGGLVFAGVGGFFIWLSFQQLHQLKGNYTLATITLVVTGAIVLTASFVHWRKFYGWQSWPTTSASIEITDVREVRTRSSHFFEATLSYWYKVNNEYYSGLYKREFYNETAAWDYAKSAKGKSVITRFNPLKPDRSKLIEEELELAIRG